MNRRSFLSRSLLSAASFGVGSALPLGRSRLFRDANAAPLITPYPVLLIIIRGGLDTAMHMVARQNGSIGKATLVNRLNSTASFKRTKTGIDYVSSVVTPTGGTDFEPHLNDVALIRAMKLEGDHAATASIWFGYRVGASKVRTGPGTTRFGRQPWASVLAAQFRQRGLIVPKPCAIAYQQNDIAFKGVEPYLDYINWAKQSPDPATVPDRILSIEGYFKSLSAAGLLPAVQRAPGLALIDALDQGIAFDTQPDYSQRFSEANGTANQVLNSLSSESAWPPPPSVLTDLGLTAAELNPNLSEDSPLRPMFALAYQALANKLAHVVAIENNAQRVNAGRGWDSHERNVARQTTHGNTLWPSLGKLVALMKKTPSPIVSGKSMFDTTNIWVQSEMGRSADAQPREVPPKSKRFILTDGNAHWPHGSALFMGGRFKRGIVIGDYTPDWTSKPINLATGNEAGGVEVNMNNLIATVMKAAGGDPSQFTNASPVDALLDMSL